MEKKKLVENVEPKRQFINLGEKGGVWSGVSHGANYRWGGFLTRGYWETI